MNETPVYELPTHELAHLRGRLEGLVNRCAGRFDTIQRELMEIRRDVELLRREQTTLAASLRKGGISQ